MQVVVVENLTFEHNATSLGPALDNITLHLQRGSRTILIGANGGQDLSPSNSLS
jgi:ABC-type Mn2+/Zn2+ transport system ATPase subunit